MANTDQVNNQDRCRYSECPRCTFILDYEQSGNKPEIKQKITEMVVNRSRIRDTARVLSVSTHTVIKTLKKTITNRKR